VEKEKSDHQYFRFLKIACTREKKNLYFKGFEKYPRNQFSDPFGFRSKSYASQSVKTTQSQAHNQIIIHPFAHGFDASNFTILRQALSSRHAPMAHQLKTHQMLALI
jgi:hypothetical protein